jgi:ribonucleoside-diphosphate reductase alpha chain
MEQAPIAAHVWDLKYRYRDGGQVHDRTIDDTWRRVATAIAHVERVDRGHWQQRFHEVVADLRFLPAGRILAGAGTTHRATLFNCFVMGPIEDSLDGIFEALKEGALTMQAGGGVGYDFSPLRPRGTPARATGGVASGPVSFMEIWDRVCATLLSTSARRGAMMATLRCDHPDIEEFVDAKREPGRLRNFNLSVQITDAFLEAVRASAPWPLAFPAGFPAHGQIPHGVVRTVAARDLWQRIVRTAYECGEPGVLFVDRINRLNNLYYREHVTTTNPCGELPLPPYGACDLGSLNLARFVVNPFSPAARLDVEGLRETTAVAVRFLDDVIDASRFPLEEQRRQAQGSRRVGLGITGLADALLMLGLDYAGVEGRVAAAGVLRAVCHAAYRASTELAREKGAFPFWDRERYLSAPFVAALPAAVREAIARDGIRNSHLIAVAPAGSISLLAGNVSSGIEPVFRADCRRRIREADATERVHELTDHAVRVWRSRSGGGAPLPPAFVDASGVRPEAQVMMQAALQPYVDGGISKTVIVPEGFGLTRFEALFELACRSGLKGFTVFRPHLPAGEVLLAEERPDALCCERAPAAP